MEPMRKAKLFGSLLPSPSWFNTKGMKMKLDAQGEGLGPISISSTAAKFKLQAYFRHIRLFYVAEWRVNFGSGWIGGGVNMSQQMLEHAFALADYPLVLPHEMEKFAQAERRKHQAEVIYPNQFIRTGRFLNFPGPANGLSDHPSISILLDEQMVEAVERSIWLAREEMKPKWAV